MGKKYLVITVAIEQSLTTRVMRELPDRLAAMILRIGGGLLRFEHTYCLEESAQAHVQDVLESVAVSYPGSAAHSEERCDGKVIPFPC